MKIRVMAFFLTFCILLGCCPGSVLGAEGAVYDTTASTVRNSDVEGLEKDWIYLVDVAGEGFVYRHTVSYRNKQYLTDYAVDQIIVSGDKLYLSVGSSLRLFNLNTQEQKELLTAEGTLLRFALSGNSLYYLSKGCLWHYDLKTEQTTPLPLRSDLKLFWLESPTELAYMVDDLFVYHYDLNTGAIRETIDSSYDFDAPVAAIDLSEPREGMTLFSLRSKFPDGKYWNHMPTMGTGPKYNNQDGWTDIPCYDHGSYCGTSKQTCNGFNPDGQQEQSWQCMGYAEKCGYDMTGYNPRKNQNGWQTYTGTSALDNLKAGDIVRYRYDRHSIYITEVTGDLVTYTDCNSDYHCGIRWDATISKSTLKASFTHVRSSPRKAVNHVNLGENFHAFLIKTDAWKHLEATETGNVQLALKGNNSTDPKQIWNFIRQKDGSYIIRNAYSDLYLDVENGGTKNGANIQVSRESGGSTQRWFIYPNGNGYSLSPAHCTALVMDVQNNSQAPGTNVYLYEPNGSGAQAFSIYDLSRNGVTYSKPPYPPASLITSIVRTGESTVTVTWTASPTFGDYDVRSYDLKVYEGSYASGDCYASATGLTDLSYTLELPKGTYTFTLSAVNTSYSNWSTLGQAYTATIDPCDTGHDYNNYLVTTVPTATEAGLLTGSCSRCGATNSIPLPRLNAKDYSYKVITSPSCTATGLGRYTWKVTTYGNLSFDVAIPETSHSYTLTVIKATCSHQGYTIYTCIGCGTGYKDEYTDALGHDYSYKVTASPTLAASGSLEGSCSRCNGTTSITLPILNEDDYSCTILEAASCTATGLGRYTWKVTAYGSYTFDEILPETGHSYTETVTQATCTTQGYTTYVCTTCSASYTGDYTAALDHSYRYDITTIPTKTEAGLLTGSCHLCENITTISMPKLSIAEYSYSILKEASCTETGITRYIWNKTDYGRIFFDVVSPVSAHRYKPDTTPPTCTTQGYTTYTCVDCGDSYPANFVKEYGHTESDWILDAEATCTTDGSKHTECTRCQEMLQSQKLPALGHSWDDGVMIQTPTATESGIISYSCTLCPETKSESIPPKDAPQCPWGQNCPSKQFFDVPQASHWAHDGIDYALEKGLFNGTGKTTFSPDTPTTRAMLVTVLWRFADQPEEGENTFSDVLGDAWYAKAVAWAAHNGVVNGVGIDRFQPNGKLTREQMATILYRYAQKKEINTEKRIDLNSFPDAQSISGYAMDALSWAVAEELITGSRKGDSIYLRPQGEASRAQVAAILMRFIEKQQEAQPETP